MGRASVSQGGRPCALGVHIFLLAPRQYVAIRRPETAQVVVGRSVLAVDCGRLHSRLRSVAAGSSVGCGRLLTSAEAGCGRLLTVSCGRLRSVAGSRLRSAAAGSLVGCGRFHSRLRPVPQSAAAGSTVGCGRFHSRLWPVPQSAAAGSTVGCGRLRPETSVGSSPTSSSSHHLRPLATAARHWC